VWKHGSLMQYPKVHSHVTACDVPLTVPVKVMVYEECAMASDCFLNVRVSFSPCMSCQCLETTFAYASKVTSWPVNVNPFRGHGVM